MTKFSERTKRLLEWWQLRIEKSHEETKENVERNDTATDSTTSVHVGSKDNERQSIEKGEK
jgi:hypothetical protein